YYYIVVHVTAPFELSDVSFNGEVGKEFSPAVKQSALTGNAKSVELAEVSLDEDAVKELEEKYGVKASAVRNGDNIDIMLEGTPTDEIVDYKIPINGKAEYIFWKLNRGPWYYFPTETARAYVTINVEKPVTTDNEVPQDPTGPEDPSDDPSTPVTTTTTGSGPMDSAPATGDDWSGMTAGLIGLIAAGGALAALRRRKERE
ncbi:MAG: LPXTG cell wall anchor domain-containing protein, partial [Anaerovoracaceae bacterium]|nr:LPXTG cell wall anchor domain-containing protein [Anaerovoracaceae bacterium]